MKTPLLLALLSALLAGCTEEYEAVFGDPVAAAHRRWLAEDEQECEHGDGGACARMADRYREGGEVPKDDARAIAYLREACDFGDRPSCNRLAQALVGKTPGIPRDPTEAGRLFERLCSRGDAVGCYNRAVMLSTARASSKATRRRCRGFRRPAR